MSEINTKGNISIEDSVRRHVGQRKVIKTNMASLFLPLLAIFAAALVARAHQTPQQGQQQQYQAAPYPYNAYPPPAPPGQEYGRALPPPPPSGSFQPPPQWLQEQLNDVQRSLTPPSIKFKIGIVADKLKEMTNQDEDTGKYKSNLREGSLYFTHNKTDPGHPMITVEFEDQKDMFPLESGINYGGKGFQLSTLNTFNGKLYSCDSKTGIVYELKKSEEMAPAEQQSQLVRGNRYNDKQQGRDLDQVDSGRNDGAEDQKKYQYVAQPWIILSNNNSNLPFKCEWGVVRDGKLWIGSTGAIAYKKDKAKTNQARNQNQQPQQDDASGESQDEQNNRSNKPQETTNERQFVKRIDENGQVETIDFSKHYEDIADVYKVNLYQGHVIHEAAEFSEATQQWLFIPRRVTKEKKNKATWDSLSTNRGVFADDPFDQLDPVEFGNLTQTSGFVGLRYIPGTDDKFILALKTGKDEQGDQVSKLAVFDETGYGIMPETVVAQGSYSDVEFL